ncbi:MULTISPECIES: hypothetical protein [unclassified Streptomyces]|uniref:hypothetical protein n=1 Tax=unclassified Streptomyces TaxID=2593676 RepID=UPI0006F48590|nr:MULTISPECIES: hypothetical protein [unclassified Streptomyces]KQX57036.1 hypothetical protein ASD33_28765 [Streptomyces sp. Root1304]KRA98617.1 hypothetical protein ASE09_25575 [Streptomyces sp. Root66D1]
MNEDVRNIVLGVLATGVSASFGWLSRTYLWRRRLRRRQAFFGLPSGSECLLVVNRLAGNERGVHATDVSALLELSALIKDCGARPRIVQHDTARQGLGEIAEFCIGGPYSNRRMAAHLPNLLPGLTMNVEQEPREDRGLITVAGGTYRPEWGVSEYVVLARLTRGEGSRPVFLLCGQAAVTNQAAARHLARHHEELTHTYGPYGSFVLLLKVVNSQAYGPDVVELVADVTREARTAPAVEPAAT